MEQSVGIRQLRQGASQVIARVAAGEALTVTDRGRPVARLVPLSGSRLDQLIQEGAVVPASGEKLPPRAPRLDGQPLSEMIADEREDRL
jgi:prevent-host-death family protein